MKKVRWYLLSYGINLALTTALGVYLGYYLDQKFGWKPYATIGCLFLGFFSGIYVFVKQAYKEQNTKPDRSGDL